jgi:predicted CoA-substrate-specific enzyme activase
MIGKSHMSLNLGLDVGAVSLKLAALGRPEDRPVLVALCKENLTFRMTEWDGRPLVLSEYRRIAGSPIQSVYDLLLEFYATVPESAVEGIRVTGSGSRAIARILGIYFENEFKAIARMMGAVHPEIRTVFEIGGESSKYIRLGSPEEGSGILDYDRSGECAAGTGSFLDQQALRMGYAVEQVGDVVRQSGRSAHIAGRCSVFAKSDMIHAQQKGYTPAEILRGLCEAVPRNFKSSIVKGRTLVAPVAFIGAVSQCSGVTEALRQVFGLTTEELIVPEYYAWSGAIGTAILESEEHRKRSFGDIHRLGQHRQETHAFENRPLSMENVVLLRDGVAPYEPPPAGEAIPAYLGIDIGSVSTNVVVLDEQCRLVHEIYLRTAGRPIEAVQQGLQEVERLWGDRLVVLGVGTTGSGRELIAEFVGADVVNDEITAHKTGAIHVSRTLGGDSGSGVDTIFEIGGQDSKFISIENGVVVDFAMNEACAAGTGSFLEEQAEKLGVSIKQEFARLALSSEAPTRLGERCTVFMERDLTGWLHQGETIPDLLAGLAYSIALNYLNRVVRGRRIGKTIYFQGGTAYNDAVAAAFAGILGKKITVPPHNGVIGAIGMALIARQWRQSTDGYSRFRGYDLTRLEMKTREFGCKACTNHCDIKEFEIEGQKSFWGDKCSDRYRKASATRRKPVIDDLFAYREKLMEEIGQTRGAPVSKGRQPLRVGLPRCMSTFDRFPFWHTFLASLGVEPVLSRPTDPKIAAAGIETSVASPCFPVQVAHGHVLSLLQSGVDYVLVPNVLDYEADEEYQSNSHLCPWNQTLPFVLKSAPRLEPFASRLLAPSVHFQLGREHVKNSLAELARKFGVRRRASDSAVEAAYHAQRSFQNRLLAAGAGALDRLEETGEPGLILLGRGYNLYDRNINCDVPRKLRRNYGANVIPLDFLVTGRESVDDLHPNMYWASGRKILEAARLAAALPNLHLVYISNFMCGPDSYIKHFTRQTAGAPLLVLQFDGHGNDAGYMTRCEAYLDSKGILRCYSPSPNDPEPKSRTRRVATSL